MDHNSLGSFSLINNEHQKSQGHIRDTILTQSLAVVSLTPGQIQASLQELQSATPISSHCHYAERDT